MILILYHLFSKIEYERLLNSFFKANIVLITKPNKDWDDKDGELQTIHHTNKDIKYLTNSKNILQHCMQKSYTHNQMVF